MLAVKAFDKKLELGEVFFIDAQAICSFGVCKESDMIGDRFGSISHKHSDMLFAVKYIGDAVLEELVTGERILLCGEGNTYKKDFNKIYEEFMLVDFGKYYSVPLSIEGALIKTEDKSIAMHIDKLKKIVDKAREYPLTFLEYGSEYEVTDEAKNVYLRYDNDARRKFLSGLREQATSNVEELSATVDEIISRYDITDENLEMAYLENDIYNFQKKKI